MRVAAIQASPVFLDAEATTEKAITLMREAASNGAELCAFPETYISGYPVWQHLTDAAGWNTEGQRDAYAAYIRGSIRADGPELAVIADAARELNLFTYMGLIERAASGGSVYCALAAIHPEAGVLAIHRKLRPTHGERLIWSSGDGSGLRVHDWKGVRVGGLNCWENWMPLARFAMYGQGEHLHVSVWPGSANLTKDISRFIAMEGRVYSLAVGGVYSMSDIPADFPLRDELRKALGEATGFFSGGSMILAPDGRVLAEAPNGEETIIYAEIDIDTVLAERQHFDPAGHYNRPDVFNFSLNRDRLDPLG